MNSKTLIGILIFLILAVFSSITYRKISYFQSGFAVQQKQTAAGIEISVENTYFKDLKLPVCEKYQTIEINLSGDRGENLKIVTHCEVDTSQINLKTILIPFAHIYSFPVQNGEFSTDPSAKIYLTNCEKKWPQRWKIKSFDFYNSLEDRFSVPTKNLELTLEPLK